MHEHTGGEQIMRVSKLVMACYAAQPEREVPHVGEIQWLFHSSSELDDPKKWRFWQNAAGDDVAVAWMGGDEYQVAIHSDVQNDALAAEIDQWGKAQIFAKAQHEGETSIKIWQAVHDDEPERMKAMERDGWDRVSYHYLKYWREIDAPVPQPILPEGFTIRHIRGEEEVAARAALHRDSFLPYSSKTNVCRFAALAGQGSHAGKGGGDASGKWRIEVSC